MADPKGINKYMSYYENVPRWIREIPRRLKTQEMCDEAVWIEPRSLSFVPNRFKTEGLCTKAVRKDLYALDCVRDSLKTQKIRNEAIHNSLAAFFLVPGRAMCNDAAEVDLWQLNDVPDDFKTQKMYDDVVRSDLYSLQFVPDWFAIQEQLKTWYYDDQYCDDDELIEWYDGYQKWKGQKASIKKELKVKKF